MLIYFDQKIFLQSISIVLSLSMIIYFVLKAKKNPLIYSYICCQIIIFIWSTGQLGLLFSHTSTHHRWISIQYEYIAVLFVGIAWLMFCLFYTFNRILKKKRIVFSLFIPPILFYIVMYTNEAHHMFFKEFTSTKIIHGPIFWLHTFWSYVYIGIGTVLLIRYSKKHMGYVRKKTLLLVLAVIIPIISNLLFIISVVFKQNFIRLEYDFTPVSFALSLLIFAVAVFKYRFLNIVPIAFKKIIQNLQYSVVVIDSLNKIDSYNGSFISAFNIEDKIPIYEDINEFIKDLRKKIVSNTDTERIIQSIKYETNNNVSGELTIGEPLKKTFSVNIQPMVSKSGEFIGRIVTFNDITESKNLLDQLNEKNIELSEMNNKLSLYASTVEELTVTKERNRFARDIHDTLGHTMILLISLLEVSNITLKNDTEKTGEKIDQAITVAREGLKDLRNSIQGLIPENFHQKDIISSMEKLTKVFGDTSGVKISLSFDNTEDLRNIQCPDVLYRVCQESLTNALRHGKATQIDIKTKYKEDKVTVIIRDNGCGCTNIKKGFGLLGMEQRVKDNNGTIIFHMGDRGFGIEVEIPVTKNMWKKGEC